jgi:hypothetical protein
MFIAGRMRESNRLKGLSRYVCIPQVLSKKKGIQEEKIMKTKNWTYKKDMLQPVQINRCTKCTTRALKVQHFPFKHIIQGSAAKMDINKHKTLMICLHNRWLFVMRTIPKIEA